MAALASWLDARAHGGQWLVRMEDVDGPRCIPGVDHVILQQLAACGLHPDAPPVWQSQRTPLYQQALEQLVTQGLAYPCACSRKDVEAALQHAGIEKPRHGELVYPGTCRQGLHGKPARAWRLRTNTCEEKSPFTLAGQAQVAINSIASSGTLVHWTDRRLGPQQQDVAQTVGDFVLQRADGLFAYQLAVVVDDADQGITHVVRGEDLCDNTARQVLLQRYLGLPTPQYLHTPLVHGDNGEKLSKQNGALAVDTSTPLAASQALCRAARVLDLPACTATYAPDVLRHAQAQWLSTWAQRYP